MASRLYAKFHTEFRFDFFISLTHFRISYNALLISLTAQDILSIIFDIAIHFTNNMILSITPTSQHFIREPIIYLQNHIISPFSRLYIE
jgi:hypothetical protein